LKITFPAIAICSRDSFLVVDAITELERCSTLGWQNGYYRHLGLFDSAGIYWSINAKVEKEPTILDRLLNRKIAVHLTLGEPELDNMSRAVGEVCELVDSDPDDLYCQFLEHSELKRRFLAACNPHEFINLARTLGGNGC